MKKKPNSFGGLTTIKKPVYKDLMNAILPISRNRKGGLETKLKRFESHLRTQNSGYPLAKVKRLESELLNHPATKKKIVPRSSHFSLF